MALSGSPGHGLSHLVLCASLTMSRLLVSRPSGWITCGTLWPSSLPSSAEPALATPDADEPAGRMRTLLHAGTVACPSCPAAIWQAPLQLHTDYPNALGFWSEAVRRPGGSGAGCWGGRAPPSLTRQVPCRYEAADTGEKAADKTADWFAKQKGKAARDLPNQADEAADEARGVVRQAADSVSDGAQYVKERCVSEGREAYGPVLACLCVSACEPAVSLAVLHESILTNRQNLVHLHGHPRTPCVDIPDLPSKAEWADSMYT